jgi:hypothetical protein
MAGIKNEAQHAAVAAGTAFGSQERGSYENHVANGNRKAQAFESALTEYRSVLGDIEGEVSTAEGLATSRFADYPNFRTKAIGLRTQAIQAAKGAFVALKRDDQNTVSSERSRYASARRELDALDARLTQELRVLEDLTGAIRRVKENAPNVVYPAFKSQITPLLGGLDALLPQLRSRLGAGDFDTFAEDVRTAVERPAKVYDQYLDVKRAVDRFHADLSTAGIQRLLVEFTEDPVYPSEAWQKVASGSLLAAQQAFTGVRANLLAGTRNYDYVTPLDTTRTEFQRFTGHRDQFRQGVANLREALSIVNGIRRGEIPQLAKSIPEAPRLADTLLRILDRYNARWAMDKAAFLKDRDRTKAGNALKEAKNSQAVLRPYIAEARRIQSLRQAIDQLRREATDLGARELVTQLDGLEGHLTSALVLLQKPPEKLDQLGSYLAQVTGQVDQADQLATVKNALFWARYGGLLVGLGLGAIGSAVAKSQLSRDHTRRVTRSTVDAVTRQGRDLIAAGAEQTLAMEAIPDNEFQNDFVAAMFMHQLLGVAFERSVAEVERIMKSRFPDHLQKVLGKGVAGVGEIINYALGSLVFDYAALRLTQPHLIPDPELNELIESLRVDRSPRIMLTAAGKLGMDEQVLARLTDAIQTGGNVDEALRMVHSEIDRIFKTEDDSSLADQVIADAAGFRADFQSILLGLVEAVARMRASNAEAWDALEGNGQRSDVENAVQQAVNGTEGSRAIATLTFDPNTPGLWGLALKRFGLPDPFVGIKDKLPFNWL